MRYNKNILIRVFSTLSILIMSMGLLISCQIDKTVSSKIDIDMKAIEGNKLYGYVLTTEHAKIIVEKDYLTESEMIDIAEKIEKGFNDVKDYLGDKYYKKNFSANERITYYIKSGAFVSRALRDIVELSNVKEGFSPYIHETVHVLAPLKNDVRWLQEGLAVYLHDHLGGQHTVPNYGKDIDKLSKEIIADNSLQDVLSFDDSFAYIDTTTASIKEKEDRRAFYIMSGSLVKYIESKYGKEKLLSIYFSKDIEDIKNITGKSFEEIKNEWLEYIENY